MHVFESTSTCCEAGLEDVVMTTAANDLQVTTAKLLQYTHYSIPRCTAVNCYSSHVDVVSLILPYRLVGQHWKKPASEVTTR